MAEQPRGYALTIRFPPETGEGLAAIRRRAGVGPTDYIRLAVWRALQADAVADAAYAFAEWVEVPPAADTGTEQEQGT